MTFLLIRMQFAEILIDVIASGPQVILHIQNAITGIPVKTTKC